MKKFSIVVPVYFNQDTLPLLISKFKGLQKKLNNYALEFIFVDDGSGDNSLAVLKNEREKDKRVKVIKLSRNFGSMYAVQAGLSYATGDCVGMTSADLQDPPELFVEMIKKWEKGKKVIIATRKEREDPLIRRIFTDTYYSLMSKYAIKNYPRGGFDFVVIDKQVLVELNKIKEKNTNIMSLIYWFGYNPCFLYYKRVRDKENVSRWTFSKRFKLFIDSFVAFSYAPIRFMSLLGLVTAILSFAYGIYVIINHLLGRISLQGYSTIIAIITFLLGVIMIMLGIIGEYLWRILDETRKRPPYIVDEAFIEEKKNVEN